MTNATFANIPMPQMGESVTEATIVKWHKAVGDPVEADETLLEISTAKVEAEIPAPCSGVVAEILHAEGETVPVDTIIARIAPPGTFIAHADPPAAPAGGASSAPVSSGDEIALREDEEAADPVAMERERRQLLARRSTPLVRSMIRELGLNLEDIPGTGRHGRVTKEDVLRFIEANGRGGSAPRPEDYPVSLPGESETLGGHRLRFGSGLEDFVEPMSAMRRAIARHMVESRRTSPHAYTVHEVDFTKMMRLREKLKGRYQKDHGAKLTPLSFILKAVTEAIVRYPMFNASVLPGDRIAYHRSVNVGVAVALERGLIVPVIRNMQDKTLPQIALALADIAARARSKKLMPADVEGGTFTITSPGQKGALMGFPILNQPQVGVLYVGAIKKRPCVIETADGTDVMAIRSIGILSLALDHRLIDGWVADSFMLDIKDRIEGGEFEDE